MEDEKITEEVVKTTEKYTKAQQKAEKATDKLKQATDNLKNGLSDISKVYTSISLADISRGLLDTAKNMVNLNSELHRTAINAGKGVEGLATYKKISNNLSIQLGATFEEAKKVTMELAKGQYAGTEKDISKAANASYMLSKAFGINAEEVTKNTIELQKWGQISANTTMAMYADITKVAQANGLTKEGVQEVMKATQNYSGVLKAFGKSPQDIQKMNLSLAKTVSVFEKVGISAQTTTEFIQKMLDPENIEANIPAYAALGVSITDAITGNIDQERMASGLKEFGEKLKTMGPIAGAAYAKAMGISYKDAIKASAADLQETAEVAMTPEEKATEQMKEMMEKTMDTTEQLNKVISQAGGMVRSLGPELLVGIATVGVFIKNKVNGKVVEFSKNLAKTIAKTIRKTLQGESIEDVMENMVKNGIKAGSQVDDAELIKLSNIDLSDTIIEIKLINKLKRDGLKVDESIAKLTEFTTQTEHDANTKKKELEEKILAVTSEKSRLEKLSEVANKDELAILNDKLKALKKQSTELIKEKSIVENEVERISNIKANIKLKLESEDFKKKVEDAKREVNNSFTKEIGKNLNAVLHPIDTMFQGAKNIKEKFGELKKQGVFKEIGKNISNVGVGLVNFGKNIKEIFHPFETVTSGVDKLKDKLSNFKFKNPFETVTNGVDKLKDKLSNFKFKNPFETKFKNPFETVTSGVDKLKDKLSNFKFKNPFETVTNGVDKLKDKLSNFKFKNPFETVTNGVDKLKDKLSNFKFKNPFETVTSGVDKLKIKLSNFKFKNPFETKFKNPFETVTNGVDKLKDKLSNLVAGFKLKVMPEINKLGKNIEDSFKSTVKKTTESIKQLPKKFKDSLAGFKNDPLGGIKNIALGFKETAKERKQRKAEKKENKQKMKEAKAEKKKLGGGGISPIAILIGLLAPLIAILKEKIQPVMQNIQEKLAPTFDLIGKVIGDMLKEISPMIEQSLPVISQLLLNLFDFIKPILPILVGVLKFIIKIINVVVTAINNAIKWIAKLFGKTIDNTAALSDNTKAQAEETKPDQITTKGGVVTVTKGSSAENKTNEVVNNNTTVVNNNVEKTTVDNTNNNVVNSVKQSMDNLSKKMDEIIARLGKTSSEVQKGVENALGLDDSKTIRTTTEDFIKTEKFKPMNKYGVMN